MAKKIKIVIDFKEDNTLLAISCHKKEYWVAYQLNEVLNIKLNRVEDLPYFNPALNSFVLYPLYYFMSDKDETAYYLLSNSNIQGKLFPAYKTNDYFLLTHGRPPETDQLNLAPKVRTIKGVQGVFDVEMDKIKDIDNFFSDLELHMINVLKSSSDSIQL